MVHLHLRTRVKTDSLYSLISEEVAAIRAQVCTFVRFREYGWEDVRDGCAAFLLFRVGSARILTGKGPPPTAEVDHHASHHGGRTMENSSLSDRPTSEDGAAVFPDSGSRREQRSHDHASASRAAARTRPTGERTRVRSWMRAGALDWGIRIAVVGLVIGGFFAIYINGVNEGWWHAWGDTPTVTTTGPTVAPSPAPSSEPAMSGGYQIGPDGVLVRPAEYAPETYTKPQLPDEAKAHTARGAELTAEHFLALETYAWNTGDIQPLADMSDPGDNFSGSYISAIKQVYSNGWAYGNNATITEIVTVEPVSTEQWGAQDETIGVLFHFRSTDGVTCIGQKIVSNETEYDSSLALFVTWKGDRWVITGGSVDRVNKQ